MSEAQNPVEEQPAPVEAAPAVEPATETKAEETVAPAVVESTTVAEATKDGEPVAGTEAPVATDTKAAAPKKEFSGEGVLGYKAPGVNFIKKIAGFQKKHFWFGSEPVEFKNLTSYLRGEKPDIANHNAAWSSQTGKGLLYFSKHPSEKATPAGIINLADISDVTEDGTVDFFFTSNGAKHVFQAGSLTERESWVAAIKKISAEAKEMVESIKNSDGYKEQHSNLSKPITVAPVAVAAAAVTKEPETKKEEKAEAKEEKKEEKARKSRSASRKRNSIFGNFGLGSKKDEPTEPKEEKKVEAKETTLAETATTEPTVAPLDGPAVAAAVVEAPVIDEPAKTEVTAAAPVEAAKPTAPANKRNSSIFGSLSSKFGSKKSVSEAKTSEAAPAVPVKDVDMVEPVSAEAPVIPAPEASEPLAAAVASPATVPVTELTNGVTEAEEAKPEVKAETKAEPVQKRKSSLPFGLGLSKEKKEDVEGEKSKSSSPFAKLRQTIKGKSPKAAEKTPEKAPEKTEESTAEPAIEPTTEPAAETPASTTEAAQTTDETIISEPISAAPAAATQVSATA